VLTLCRAGWAAVFTCSAQVNERLLACYDVTQVRLGVLFLAAALLHRVLSSQLADGSGSDAIR